MCHFATVFASSADVKTKWFYAFVFTIESVLISFSIWFLRSIYNCFVATFDGIRFSARLIRQLCVFLLWYNEINIYRISTITFSMFCKIIRSISQTKWEWLKRFNSFEHYTNYKLHALNFHLDNGQRIYWNWCVSVSFARCLCWRQHFRFESIWCNLYECVYAQMMCPSFAINCNRYGWPFVLFQYARRRINWRTITTFDADQSEITVRACFIFIDVKLQNKIFFLILCSTDDRSSGDGKHFFFIQKLFQFFPWNLWRLKKMEKKINNFIFSPFVFASMLLAIQVIVWFKKFFTEKHMLRSNAMASNVQSK